MNAFFLSVRRHLAVILRMWPNAVLLVLIASVSSTSAATYSVTNTSDSGAGTLRQAITAANASPGADLITFSIAGTGVKTFTVSNVLPQISDTVTIDGTTQPGYSGLPLIELNGQTAGNSADGLEIFADNCVVRGLIINRFAHDAIHIQNGTGTRIEGNFLGTDSTGKISRGNGDGGVTIAQSYGNTIGGTTAASRNILSGNGAGIFILSGSSGNKVLGNYIGMDITGTNSLGNSNSGGIKLIASPDNIIGGLLAGSGNIISGNGAAGIVVQGSPDVVIQGNYIGTDVNGRLARGNSSDGILIDGAPNVIIGGQQAGARNVISGNNNTGIFIRGSGATSTSIQGNLIGTDATGTNRLGNTSSGVYISSISGTLIGGTNSASRNVISGNSGSGILIEGGLASNNVVQGNFIGVDITGRKAVSNVFNGVTLSGSPSNQIGGGSVGAGNIISGNGQNGVHLADGRANGNYVQGNWIGVDVTGTNNLGNNFGGVRIETTGNFIGGTNSEDKNVISANTQSGVYLLGSTASNNVVAGNFIGTDVSGMRSLGNMIAGIGVSGGKLNQLGRPGAGNVISGNTDSGIYLKDGGTANVIQGNRIGCNVTGVAALPNVLGGIYIYGVSNTVIGGTALGAGNQVAGNLQVGISIGDPGANNTLIQGNLIGVKADGTNNLGNFQHNIEILNSSLNNIIGGTSPRTGNRIAFCQTALYAGVRVRDGCTGNSIQGNSIFSNNGLGIDLGANGANANDGCDADVGANNLQNYPVLTVTTGRYLTTIQGTLNAKANSDFTVDFYASPSGDPTGYGEGMTWLGAQPVHTDGSCNATFTVKFTNSLPVGVQISATATDSGGNTSEFNLTKLLQAYPDSDADGMPDDYEMAYGLNPALNDGASDKDGDGVSNKTEFLAGTRPNDAASVTKLAIVTIALPQVLLRFNSVSGKTYSVSYSDKLGGAWTSLASNLVGNGSALDINDATATTNRFYKLSVEP